VRLKRRVLPGRPLRQRRGRAGGTAAHPPRHLPVRVAILINNTYVADARAWKTAVSLGRAGYQVTVIARWAPGLATTERLDHHTVARIRQPQPLTWLPAPSLPETGDDPTGRTGGIRRRTRDSVGRAAQALRYLRMSRAWSALIAEQVEPFDVWQAESVITLSQAVALRRHFGGIVVYDANDIDSEAGRMASLPGPWKQLLRRHERRLARAADAVVTVSEPYAQILARILGRPVDAVVRNAALVERPEAPATADEVIRSDHIVRRFELPPEQRIVLYIGQVMRGRGLRQLFEAISLVQDAHLVIAGFGPDYERYQTIAAALPHARRIHFAGAVAPADIAAWTRGADVSAMPVQPDTLNHRFNTPTKLYDAMGVGVPVVASRLPGISPIVNETGCGVLCDPADPADVARAIREVIDASPEERAALRMRCLDAARERYSWQHQARELLRVYDELGV
jgi:glycosyltransferase involved in cell wall biosynthesis